MKPWAWTLLVIIVWVVVSWAILNGPWWPAIRDWIVSLGPMGG